MLGRRCATNSPRRRDHSHRIILLTTSHVADRPQIFPKKKLKKSLPNVAIPGISRLRAATTLLATGNYIASRCLQRSRVRAGAGPDNAGFYRSSSREKEGSTGDRKRANASDCKGGDASGRKKAGASDCDRAWATAYSRARPSNRKTIRKRDGSAG
jgi:hypothetical protein